MIDDLTDRSADRPLGDELAKHLIASRFPGFETAHVTGRYEGMDHYAVEVASDWIFRFPKRAGCASMLLRELRLLPVVEPLLAVAVPRYEFVGPPSVEYPFTFAGYRKLSGIPAIEYPPESVDLNHLAACLGGILSSLHAIPMEVVERLGMVGLEDFEDLASLRVSTLEELDEIRDVLSTEVFDQCRTMIDRDDASMAPYLGPPRLLHGDLSAEHLILGTRSGRVVALIDWADACFGDPAYDLKYFWVWLGEAFINRLLENHKEHADPWFRERVRFYGICTAIGEVAYGRSTGRTANLRQGLVALSRTFAEA